MTTAVEVGVCLLAQVHALVLCQREAAAQHHSVGVSGKVKGARCWGLEEVSREAREAHTCHHLEGSHTDVILCHFLEELVWQEKGWSVRAQCQQPWDYPVTQPSRLLSASSGAPVSSCCEAQDSTHPHSGLSFAEYRTEFYSGRGFDHWARGQGRSCFCWESQECFPFGPVSDNMQML